MVPSPARVSPIVLDPRVLAKAREAVNHLQGGVLHSGPSTLIP